MKSASSHNSHPSSLSFFSKNEILIKYTLVPSIPLSIIAILSINANTWVLSEIHHFYIEMFAVILAAILSFYYMARARTLNRSEEHTSELQSSYDLVCRLLLEKKNISHL